MKHIFWMLVALLALVVVGSFFIPIAPRVNKRHAEEAILKEELHAMREAIDQYTEEKGRSPESLDDLVKAGYLQTLPTNPFTGSRLSWKAIREDDTEKPKDTAGKPIKYPK